MYKIYLVPILLSLSMCAPAPVTPPANAIPREQMEMIMGALEYLREYEVNQNRTEPDDAINSALNDFWENTDGSDDTTESEELLQLSSDKDRQGFGWRYDRCNYRSLFRPLQEGESKDSWCRHTRKTHEGPRRESTGPRRYELVERKTN